MAVKLHLNLINNRKNHLDLKLKQIQNKLVVLKLKVVMNKRKRSKLMIKQNKVKAVVQQLQQIT